MTAKTYTRSFAGGEIAPLLRGRVDLAKNQTGLAICLNFQVTPQGPVESRPGYEFVVRALQDPAGAPPALIPFVYNAQQSFALEFGNTYIRFHTQGGTLLETGKAITGITQANPGVFNVVAHGMVAGDWVQLAGIGGMTALNGRWVYVASAPDADHLTLTDVFGTVLDTSALPAYTAGGTVSRVYQIASPYASGDLFDLHYVQSADVLTIVHPGYAPRELRRLGATNWTLTTIVFAPTIAQPSAPGLATTGPGGGTPASHEYAVTAVASTGEESERSGANAAAWDLTVVGNALEITPVTVAGALRYNIYKSQGGVFGFIGQSDGSTLTDANIQPDMSKTPPLVDNPFGGESPRAVSYFEQRRWFGGGGTNPQNIWSTRSGTESSMMYSIPSQEDDRISARIVARKAQTVRHLVPMADLMALTSGGVWRIAASDGGAITPATASFKPVSYVGASNVQPAEAGEAVLYAQDRGSHIRELSYKGDPLSGGARYSAEDISVLAPHLFDFHQVVQMTTASAPIQVVWMVRDDGVLLGLTYQPEHEVKAWHRHTTAGLFKSICCIPEGGEDGVYAVVRRTVGGADYYLIERQHTRQFAALEDCFFLDSGVTYDGAPATVISGLWHLEGVLVSILADGGVHPRRTVVGGSITLDYPGSKVHIGRGYDADFQTVPIAMEAAPAFGVGIPKNINKVDLSVYQSGAGIMAGPSFERLREYASRTVATPYGSPPPLKTGLAEIMLDPAWQQEGSLCVRQSNPLPLTVRSITIEVAT